MSLDKLRAELAKAEERAFKLTAQKEEIREKLRAASEDVAARQKALSDAEAAHALADRDLPESEKQRIAQALGLELP